MSASGSLRLYFFPKPAYSAPGVLLRTRRSRSGRRAIVLMRFAALLAGLCVIGPSIFGQETSASASASQTGSPADLTEERSVQMHYNIHQQPPVYLEKAYPLPVFCVSADLTAPEPIAIIPHPQNYTCPAGSRARKLASQNSVVRLPAANADDIIKELQTGTEFSLSKADDNHIAIFCKIRNCSSLSLRKLEKAIDQLAQPAYTRYRDVQIGGDGTPAKKIARAVPAFVDGLDAEVIDPNTVRIESSQRLNPFENTTLQREWDKSIKRIAEKKPLAMPEMKTQAVRVDLPQMCVPVHSMAVSYKGLNDDGKCDDGFREQQAANAHAIATQLNASLTKSSEFTVSDDANAVVITCSKAACSGASFKQLAASILSLARPAVPYSEDITVPKNTSHMAAAYLTRNGLNAFPLDATLVRITSNTPIPDSELQARLAGLNDRGFGEPAPPPLQRLFYEDASNVIASLLTTPLPQAPVPVAQQAPNTGPTPASTATTTTPTAGVVVTVNPPPPPPPPPPSTPSAPITGPAATGTVGEGMTAVQDNIVFTDTSDTDAVRQRVRLLTMLDLPRPEVLMNVWSLQASSPNGREIQQSLGDVRKAVEAHNDALQNAIDYGWSYFSREMKNPEFFDNSFAGFLSHRFVSDSEECEAQPSTHRAAPCITEDQRREWGLCAAGQYCLGYTGIFDPLRPTLTNILLGMMAARDPFRAVLTGIGCMQGQWEVYPECFPDRPGVAGHLNVSTDAGDLRAKLQADQERYLQGIPEQKKLSCEVLDQAALSAQQTEKLPVALPLNCFLIQAAKSFLPTHSFSTFSVDQLRNFAEVNLVPVGEEFAPTEAGFSATNIGLLRSAVASFLFSYKMAQEFPNEISSYNLAHSAQELNSLFNPLVVAFNQDVAMFSRTLMDRSQQDVTNNANPFWFWRHNREFVANGLVTIRGISGIESLIDTDTQSSFDATQAQTLNQVIGNLMGSQSGAPQTASGTNPAGAATSSTPALSPAAAPILKGSLNPASVASAVAAITPTPAQALIGRQLTLDVIPHSLPGASAAELDVKLWAQEDAPPTVYPAGNSSGQNDTVSRVARHNVATRVRVESVKLFDLSSFSAMVQRPRAKLPIIPPLIELPLINSLASIPLPAAKMYYASSAIVSAIIVPTAADLAYGIEFTGDRAVFTDRTWRRFSSTNQLPDAVHIYSYEKAVVACLATNQQRPVSSVAQHQLTCDNVRFWNLPNER